VYFAKTRDLNVCPLFRMTLAYGFTGPSLSQQYAPPCRLQGTCCTQGLIKSPPFDEYRMKSFIMLNVVYCICVNSAVLHVLPYVFELLRLTLLRV